MQGICFDQREEFCEERFGAFRLPQEGKGKQTKLDNVGSDTADNNGVAELQKVLQMSICVLIWLATKWASLHHVNEA